MKRKLTTTFAIGLLLVALIALAIAPAASAKASFIQITGTEQFLGGEQVAYHESGGVAHMEFLNHFWDNGSPGSGMDGDNYTHLYAVATLVDGAPGPAIVRGTWHKESTDGNVWEGTFGGTLDFSTFTWDCPCRGMCISGPMKGAVCFIDTVATVPGYAEVTGWAVLPRGM